MIFLSFNGTKKESPQNLLNKPILIIEWLYRVLAILALWVEKHGLIQDDPCVETQLREFLNTITFPPSVALSAKHLIQTLDKLVRRRFIYINIYCFNKEY